MVTTRGANGIRKPSIPYRSPSSTTALATPIRSKTTGARKASSSTPNTPVKKRKSPNAHIQQTPPPKLRSNHQKEIETEAWNELKSPASSVHADDAWVFSDLPIMLRRDPMKDDTDTIRVNLSPHFEDEEKDDEEDDEEDEEFMELPVGYMSKRFTVLDAPFGDEDDWATDYESDGDVPMKLAVKPPKPKLNSNMQCEQWEEFKDDTPMMSDPESVHSDLDYLTMWEDRDKIELSVALDFEIEELRKEAEEVEHAQHPKLYNTYSVASDFDTPYDYEEDEATDAERLLNPVQEYDTWSVAADFDTPLDPEDDELSSEWSPKKKRKVMDTMEEELDMESLYISQEEEEEEKEESDAENEDKPSTPPLRRSDDPGEWRFGFTELQTPYTIETVPRSRPFSDNLPLTLGSFTFKTPSHGRTAQLATPPDSNRGSASPICGMQMDLDRDVSSSPSLNGSLFEEYQAPPPSTPTDSASNWGRIMSQHFPEHAKHLCKSGRTPQAELEYIRKNSGFNSSFIDKLDRMHPRQNKPMMKDAAMPRTGRRAPVTEKRGDFVLAEDYTATKGRSRAQLQYWPSA